MKKGFTWIMAIVLSLVLMQTACGTSGVPTGADDGKIVIGVAFAGVDVGFWSANYEGLENTAKDLGAEVILVVSEGDANKQNDQIRNLIAQQVDVLVVACVDGSAVASAVKEAQTAGIPVIMNNRPLQSDDVQAEMSILSDNEQMAYDQLIWLAGKAREEGAQYNILLLIGGLGDENAVQRANGHRKAVQENSDVLSITVEVPTDWKTEAALAGVQNSMQAYADINCIVSPSDYFIAPVQSALEQINRWKPTGENGHIVFLTFDGDANAMKGLEEGYIDCTSIQDAYKAGVDSAQWAVKLANGEKPNDPLLLDDGILATLDNFDEIKETLWAWPIYQEAK